VTTALAVPDAAPLAIQPGQEMWTDKQRAALAVLGIKDATNGDLAVFMHVCQRTGLDPFSRQIYMIKRREKVGDQWVDKQTIQVGIDGFRVIRDRAALRTGCLVELEDTAWYDADGTEHAVWLTAEPPIACKVVLLKHQGGRVLRYPAVLRTAAYMAVTSSGLAMAQWKTQPDHMIEKCCEAFATRRAFPHDLGGIYIEEEMHSSSGLADQPAVRRVTRAEIIREQPGQPAAGDQVNHDDPAGQEPGQPAEITATAGEVNAEFKRLGYTVRDKNEVLRVATILAGRHSGRDIAELAVLNGAELGRVRDALAACPDEAGLAELLDRIGQPEGEAAGE